MNDGFRSSLRRTFLPDGAILTEEQLKQVNYAVEGYSDKETGLFLINFATATNNTIMDVSEFYDELNVSDDKKKIIMSIIKNIYMMNLGLGFDLDIMGAYKIYKDSLGDESLDKALLISEVAFITKGKRRKTLQDIESICYANNCQIKRGYERFKKDLSLVKKNGRLCEIFKEQGVSINSFIVGVEEANSSVSEAIELYLLLADVVFENDRKKLSNIWNSFISLASNNKDATLTDAFLIFFSRMRINPNYKSDFRLKSITNNLRLHRDISNIINSDEKDKEKSIAEIFSTIASNRDIGTVKDKAQEAMLNKIKPYLTAHPESSMDYFCGRIAPEVENECLELIEYETKKIETGKSSRTSEIVQRKIDILIPIIEYQARVASVSKESRHTPKGFGGDYHKFILFCRCVERARNKQMGISKEGFYYEDLYQLVDEYSQSYDKRKEPDIQKLIKDMLSMKVKDIR